MLTRLTVRVTLWLMCWLVTTVLQAAGIEYYNFGWEDMTAPTVLFMQVRLRAESCILPCRGLQVTVNAVLILPMAELSDVVTNSPC